MTFVRNSILLIAVLAIAGPALAVEPFQDFMKRGEWQAAYDLIKPQLLDRSHSDGKQLAQQIRAAMDCLGRLNRINEADALLKQVVETHHDRWQANLAAARGYDNLPHYGYLIAGEFRRGNHRGGGRLINTADTDRVRSLQLWWTGIKQLEQAANGQPQAFQQQLANAYRRLAKKLNNRNSGAALLRLTDLATQPSYEPSWGNDGGNSHAPVDANGDPILFNTPESWDAARNDGERWRWALAQMTRIAPGKQREATLMQAEFLHGQFGVQTLARFGLRGWSSSDEPDGKSSTFALHTLGEDETIARLATGVRRFKLPAEHHPIALHQQLLADELKNGNRDLISRTAGALATIFENRRQYDRAAEYRRIALEHADGQHRRHHELSIKQIESPLGQFEPTFTQPAGQGAKLDFRFRNATRVELTARRVNVEKLLADVWSYLESKPKKLNSSKLQVEQIGYRLLRDEGEKYLGEEVARWTKELKPAEGHFDRRVTIDTPLEDAGAYFVTARIADGDTTGNTSRIVLWVADMAIVRKPLDGKMMHFVADAVTGKPVAGAQVDFLGYRQLHNQKPNDFRIETTRFARQTDGDGMVLVDPKEASSDNRLRWLATARTDDGRQAFLGFRSIWLPTSNRQQHDSAKAVVLTDRPVYRPGQPVHFKAWIARARYGANADASEFAHKAFQVEVYNAKNEKIETRTLTANAYGGLVGELSLDEGTPLGVYRLQVAGYGGGTFRVEEYKKPEFEVAVDAPSEEVRLGETFTAKITARYYFGAPVTNATVKYRVVRTEQSASWFPVMPWDWLYGQGYWWPCGDDRWYPGWSRWGCRLPAPQWSWWWRPTPPPEVVAEGEAPISDDGTVDVMIDTTLAKELHGNTDHRYRITAEVVDGSRRTIVGTGSVLATRKAIQTLAWLDQGYYRAGDPVTVRTSTRRPDGAPLAASGVLRLLKVTYPIADIAGGDSIEPKETEVRRWDLASNATGTAELQFKATEPGRYRISYTARTGEREGNDQAESGCLFTVIGNEGEGADDLAYDDLELVLDRQQYQPGDTAQLRVQTKQRNAVVLLFVRAESGSRFGGSNAYPTPIVLRLDGRAAIVPIEITRADMPNAFVEAVTIHGGKVHTRVRELIVPPESRVANVEVLPSAEAYQPGQEAKIKLRVTDAAGAPVVGDTVVSIYDKSIDYIAGSGNALDLREYFWKWKRSHSPRTEHTLARVERNLVPPGQQKLKPIGIFGQQVVDDLPVRQRDRATSGAFDGGGVRLKGATDAQQGAPPVSALAIAGDRFSSDAEQADAATTPLVEPTIRSEFADTALWVGSIETDAAGLAEVSLTMPENLTAWRARVWSMSSGTRVGQGEAEVVTRKNLLVRLQTPRFLIDTDEVILSANVHNYLKSEKQVEVRLALEGHALEAATDNLTQTITIGPHNEARVDWRVKAVREGEAIVTAAASTDEESDAMQLKLPVYVHGAERVESFTGVVDKANRIGAFEINVPAKRRVEQSRLVVRYSPTLVGTMIDALPYLIEYPHGCTEQTLNRFLPAVLTQRTLERLGVDLAKAKSGTEKADKSKEPAASIRDRIKRNPVFDRAELDKIVRIGVRRLQDMQLADGGWGWFSGWSERSSAHTTAVVVRGLLVAEENGTAIVEAVLNRGVAWLERYEARELQKLRNAPTKTDPWKSHADNTDALVFAALAEAGKRNGAMEKLLVRDRLKLQPYTLAMLGLALHQHENVADRDQVIRNLKQRVVEDAENQTAYLNLPGGGWWHWHGSEFEAHAYFLKLLSATEAKSDLAAGVVKYLVNNRRNATYWNSTRDTALVIEAMTDYLAASGESTEEMAIEVWVDGQKRKESTIKAADAVTFDGRFELVGDALTAGRHTVELRKQGTGRLYYSATLANFTLVDDIHSAGLEVRVARKYYKLTPDDTKIDVAGSRGQPVSQRVEKFKRTEIVNLAAVTSGDLIEVELTIDSKNDYEYLLLTDPKPAGFEPVELRSGYNGNELRAYVEYRDAAVNLFAQQIARGPHSVTYRLRAETPGRFSALPTQISAMYAPGLRGNSDELKVRVEDRAE